MYPKRTSIFIVLVCTYICPVPVLVCLYLYQGETWVNSGSLFLNSRALSLSFCLRSSIQTFIDP
jgi:hypothetical protein